MKPSAEENRRIRTIIGRLDKAHPDARLDLEFSTPFELLVALILAAQCTDDRVNEITSALLFEKYPTPQHYLDVAVDELETDIRPTGFYRSKARSLRGCCAQLVEEFSGEVPRTLEELIRLRGVGRKTANILRGNAFGDDAIGVDTHVGRLSRHLGFTSNKDPDKVEADLTDSVPRTHWTHFCHLLQAHGRRVCFARKPRCYECTLESLCRNPDKTAKPVDKKPKPAFGRKVAKGGTR